MGIMGVKSGSRAEIPGVKKWWEGERGGSAVDDDESARFLSRALAVGREESLTGSASLHMSDMPRFTLQWWQGKFVVVSRVTKVLTERKGGQRLCLPSFAGSGFFTRL